MGLSVLLDAGLNPVFILGLGPAPQMGIAGSATATLIANYVSLAALIGYIYARDLPIRLRGREWGYLVPEPTLLRVIVAKGFPMGLQMLVVSLSSLVMIGLVNREGLVVTAAYGVAQQLWTYIQMPAMAIGAAVSAMAAQNIGAGRWDRIGSITRSGILFNLILTGGAVVVLTLIDRQALGLFLGTNSPALPIARHIHLVAGWGFILFGVVMVLMGVVRANGSVIGPLIILFIALFVARLGFAWWGRPLIGADAIWWSFPVGFGAATLLAIGHYRFGGWRKAKLIEQVDEQEAEERALADGDPCGKLSPTA
jgi:Na+-driven multidrug efflux pump